MATGGENRHSSHEDSHKLLEAHTHGSSRHEKPRSHLPYDTSSSSTQRSRESTKRSSRRSTSSSSPDQPKGSSSEAEVRGREMEDLIRQLEEVTVDRNVLRDNQKRVKALFESRIKRLEQQLVSGRSWQGLAY